MLDLSNFEFLIIGFLFLVGINSLISYCLSYSSLRTFHQTKLYSKGINKIKFYDTFILTPLILITGSLYILFSYFFFVEVLVISDFFITLSILFAFILTLITVFISRLPYCYACNVLLKTKYGEKECFEENLFNILNVFFPLFLISFVISVVYLLPIKSIYQTLIIGIFILGYLVINIILKPQNEIMRLKARRVRNDDILVTLDYLFEENNIKKYKLYYWDSSKSNEDNAFVVSVFTHHVFISTTLIDKLSLKELEAVVLHEIGHIKNKHVLKKFMMESLGIFLTGIIFILLLILNKLDIFSVSILIMIFALFMGNDIRKNRKSEQEADMFVYSKGYGKDLMEALKKLNYDKNSNESKMNKVVSSHPSLNKRINNLDKK